jgi:hypothetical protein
VRVRTRFQEIRGDEMPENPAPDGVEHQPASTWQQMKVRTAAQKMFRSRAVTNPSVKLWNRIMPIFNAIRA